MNENESHGYKWSRKEGCTVIGNNANTIAAMNACGLRDVGWTIEDVSAAKSNYAAVNGHTQACLVGPGLIGDWFKPWKPEPAVLVHTHYNFTPGPLSDADVDRIAKRLAEILREPGDLPTNEESQNTVDAMIKQVEFVSARKYKALTNQKETP